MARSVLNLSNERYTVKVIVVIVLVIGAIVADALAVGGKENRLGRRHRKLRAGRRAGQVSGVRVRDSSVARGIVEQASGPGTDRSRRRGPPTQIPAASTPDEDESTRPWKINQDICPPVLCGEVPLAAPLLSTTEVQSEPTRVKGGSKKKTFEFFEGDIVLDGEMKERMNLAKRRKTRSIVRPISRLWKYGIVPIEIDQSLGPDMIDLIESAFAEIEKTTCITFKPRTDSDKDYLHYINSAGCWSLVGNKGEGAQYVSLGYGCDHLGTILHETAHALGLWHEQSRPDRNKYVKILNENIPKAYRGQFGKLSSSQSTSRGYVYDYGSIMHYGHKYFTGNGKPTIEVIGIGKKMNLKIGQRKELSNIDIAQLRAMYYCNAKQASKEACKEGWYKHQRMCYKFVTDDKQHFRGAERQCQKLDGRLLNIRNKEEDDFIKKYLINHHPNNTQWRTGGKLHRKRFVWVGRKGGKSEVMNYTAWAPSQPGKRNSLVLEKFNGTPPRFVWKGVFTGSSKSRRKYGFNYICEANLNVDCIYTKYKDARDYRGFKSYTTGGITCQKWSSQYPHSHNYLSGNPGKDALNGLGDHNYCRNPRGKRERPWCFVPLKDVKWQYCDVEVCEEE